MQQKLKSGKT